MLVQRTITALILVLAVLLGILLADTAWLALIMGIIVCMGAWEWTKFAGYWHNLFGLLYLVVVALLLVGCYLLLNTPWVSIIIYSAALWWLLAFGLIIAEERQQFSLPRSPILTLCIGLVVLIPAWLGIVILHSALSDDGSMHLIFLLFLVWTADIAAYFIGKKWGKSHLASHISPGKTWEGVYGAIVACILVTYLYTIKLQLQLYDNIIFLILSTLIVAASITGDLLVSVMKRHANLKDSGSIFPGHGGVLDRIDSLTAATPVYLAITTLTGIGA